jgi:hypothetical protein
MMNIKQSGEWGPKRKESDIFFSFRLWGDGGGGGA